MRFIVKHNERVINEVRFDKGPIYIGRHQKSQICLPDGAVSREHAAIFTTEDGKFMVKDMDSANKTYLNDEVIREAEIKTGDTIRITDFVIEVNLKDDTKEDRRAKSEDTTRFEAALATPPHDIVVRKPDAGHAPAMRLEAKRLTDFSQATEELGKAKSLDELLKVLLSITLRQFNAFHVWCALRDQATGPMTYHAGKRRDGKSVQLSEIKLKDKIDQAVEKGQSLVLPRVAAKVEETERIRSAMIAAIKRHAGCFGVLYVDNAMVHQHYSLSDLDYLMLLAIHTASILKNL
ncbi:MAG: FHA domain-containing protein [Planctomycetota bacterium]|jgi:pSer/pThr/pTyr-binding forkhead associated (FHA) protein